MILPPSLLAGDPPGTASGAPSRCRGVVVSSSLLATMHTLTLLSTASHESVHSSPSGILPTDFPNSQLLPSNDMNVNEQSHVF